MNGQVILVKWSRCLQGLHEADAGAAFLRGWGHGDTTPELLASSRSHPSIKALYSDPVSQVGSIRCSGLRAEKKNKHSWFCLDENEDAFLCCPLLCEAAAVSFFQNIVF